MNVGDRVENVSGYQPGIVRAKFTTRTGETCVVVECDSGALRIYSSKQLRVIEE